uniref:Uncharacterized protein n=1 Tax=Rhizophora mucronata TaxID=61149 RepID=A0A2P2P6L5_RHIMU
MKDEHHISADNTLPIFVNINILSTCSIIYVILKIPKRNKLLQEK